MICGFCHATMPERDYVEHDIRMHDGLARTEDTHRLACGFIPGGTCFCRIEEYRRVGRALGRLT